MHILQSVGTDFKLVGAATNASSSEGTVTAAAVGVLAAGFVGDDAASSLWPLVHLLLLYSCFPDMIYRMIPLGVRLS